MVNQKNKDALQGIKKTFSENQYVYMVDYKGLTVSKISALRNQLRESNSEMKVLKNTLVLLALQKMYPEVYSQIKDVLTGQTAIIFSEKDPVAPAKVLVDFAKKNDSMILKGGLLESKIINGKEMVSLSALPSKEVLIAKLLMLLNSPVTGFVGALQGNLRNIVYILDAIKDKKTA
ncbi:MAG: 50S ribosomal protein L10 [Candidatus Margulisbacteria bacterium]|nr:50S ribosomal protein L10 [Candidatus Margulisiibacteriota bacterium]